MNVAISSKPKEQFQAQRFGLYLAIVSMVMMFAALTSAYIVRKSAGNWLEFELPAIFGLNTFVIVGSSITLHLGYIFFVRGKEQLYKAMLWLTFALGFAFIILQYQGYLYMNNELDLWLHTNPSSSFVFVISGIHAAHLIGGIGALLYLLIKSIMVPYKLTEKSKNGFEMVLIFWHFVDALWIYLWLFLLTQ